jgi:sulfatase modifying factor 1
MSIIQKSSRVRRSTHRFKHALFLAALVGYEANLLVSREAFAAPVPTEFTWVTIEDVGNPADLLNSGTVPGIGSVSYPYRISAYEVTNAQYVEFLNAVAKSDPHSLYSIFMTSISSSGINRSGSNGNYVYTTKPARDNNPVNQVDWYDAARFVNWLHNGKPPGISAGTENGVYNLSLQSSNPAAIQREAGAKFFLPTENEWYKAAYYDPTSGAGGGDNYWLYPTQTNDPPNSDNPSALSTPDNTNVANIYRDGNFGGTYNNGYAATQSQNFNIAQNYLFDVGAYGLTPNHYGTKDQAGGVLEWLETNDGINRFVRGGGWGNGHEATWSHYRLAIETSRSDNLTGFRIASAVPEPKSIAMLVGLALAPLLWRRMELCT